MLEYEVKNKKIDVRVKSNVSSLTDRALINVEGVGSEFFADSLFQQYAINSRRLRPIDTGLGLAIAINHLKKAGWDISLISGEEILGQSFPFEGDVITSHKDAIPSNLTKKVITNIQGEQQTVYVAPEENKIASLVKHHVQKTLETDELPSRAEIAKVGGAVLQEFFKDPVKAISDGFKREKMARDAYELAFGKKVPSKMEVTGKAMKLAGTKMKEFAISPDGAVAAAGITGSIVGGAVAGPAGALAGDLLGSLAVRKISEAHTAYKKAQDGLKDAEPWDEVNAVSKLKLKAGQTLSELKTPEMQKSLEKELVGDVAGWAIGNSVAIAVGKAVPGLSWVPSGAISAVATVPTVVVPMAQKAHKLRQEGATPSEAAKAAFDEHFMAGTKKEKAARAAFTAKMKQTKALISYAQNQF